MFTEHVSQYRHGLALLERQYTQRTMTEHMIPSCKSSNRLPILSCGNRSKKHHTHVPSCLGAKRPRNLFCISQVDVRMESSGPSNELHPRSAELSETCL